MQNRIIVVRVHKSLVDCKTSGRGQAKERNHDQYYVDKRNLFPGMRTAGRRGVQSMRDYGYQPMFRRNL